LFKLALAVEPVKQTIPSIGTKPVSDKPQEVMIYHNPLCTKSRQTLKLLRDNGIQPIIVEYLNTPLNEKELQSILKLLGITARELMRTKERVYKQQGLGDPNRTSAELISAMVEHPILIERPIVLAHGKAALGRPPEKVLGIL